MAGEDFDAGEVDLGGTVFDVEHADVCPAGGDDLPAARIEPAGVEATLALLVPSPDRGDVAAHGGLVQAEAELAIGSGRRTQPDAGPCRSPARRRDAGDNRMPAGHAYMAPCCTGHCQERGSRRLCSTTTPIGVKRCPVTRMSRFTLLTCDTIGRPEGLRLGDL